jgi:hypothetical protein
MRLTIWGQDDSVVSVPCDVCYDNVAYIENHGGFTRVVLKGGRGDIFFDVGEEFVDVVRMYYRERDKDEHPEDEVAVFTIPDDRV